MTAISSGATASHTFTTNAKLAITLGPNERCIVSVANSAGQQIYSDVLSNSRTIGAFPSGSVATMTAYGAEIDYTVTPEVITNDANRFFVVKTMTLATMLATIGASGDAVQPSDYPSAPVFRWDPTDLHWKAQGGRFLLAKVGAQTTVTGTTSPTAAYTLTIPGGLIGKNGTLELTFLYNVNNDASVKTLAVLYGGTQFASAGGTAIESLQSLVRITNQGSNSVQVSHPSITVGIGATQTELIRGTIASASDQTLEFRITLADGTDTATLEDITVAVVHGG